MMLQRLGIVAMVLSVVLAGWWSPCCCQNDWAAAQGAVLLRSSAAMGHTGCGCCEKKEADPSHEPGCPERGKSCARAGGETTAPAVTTFVLPSAAVWVRVDVASTPTGTRASGNDPVETRWRASRPGWGTLLGLRCALVV